MSKTILLPDDYISINKKLWDERTKHHLQSAFYDQQSFLNGRNTLHAIELNLLDDVADKTLLHLQCHFGQDSLSLARMGAKVTGVDLSTEAIKAAKATAGKLRLKADFINCNLYDLPEHLDRSFDIVFTSYGTIGWLPDLKKWAEIIGRYLKPGGKFILTEFHPFIWMLDNNFKKIIYDYFNTAPIIEEENGTYADKNANISLKSVSWNHSLHEVIQNLINEGLTLEHFEEFDYSPYNIFPDATPLAGNKFQIKDLEGRLPLVYSLKMSKKYLSQPL